MEDKIVYWIRMAALFYIRFVFPRTPDCITALFGASSWDSCNNSSHLTRVMQISPILLPIVLLYGTRSHGS